MEEKKPVVKKKVRAEKYEEKVSFDGTLEQMIAMAVKPVHHKHKPGDELKAKIEAKKQANNGNK